MTASERFATEYQEYNDLSFYRRREQLGLIEDIERQAEKEATECSADDVRAYFAGLSALGTYHPNTIRKKLNMVKPFFRWAWSVGLLDADTYLRIRDVKPPAKSSATGKPRPYKRPELTQFYRELDAKFPRLDSDYFWRRFDKGTSPFRRVRRDAMRAQMDAVVALALHCGLRRQEIFDCTLEDIHPDNEYVVVRNGKGGKEREVPHTDASRAAIQKWIEVRHRLKPARSNKSAWLALWGTTKRKWAAPMTIRKFVTLMSSLGSGWEFHRFRHTCGTEWLRSTERIELVRKLLGHSRITQTEGYAEVVASDLARAMEKAQRQFGDAVGDVADMAGAPQQHAGEAVT